MIQLGVNIDHVATLRQSRHTTYPSPVEAALIAETAGADFITLHLREDRRHIQDMDVIIMRQAIKTRMNLEMAMTEEMLQHALSIKPDNVCLVPEKREELTTEGGLDVVRYFSDVEYFVKQLKQAAIRVSLFIDAAKEQIDAAHQVGAQMVELHTGHYANANDLEEAQVAMEKITSMASYAANQGIYVAAGHGLSYHNVQPITMIHEISELNIGHAIISQALVVGMAAAVKAMKALIWEGYLAR
ncbi:MAG: pyridoxine 5'-phosphate synthase [Neisseriales bacterium]|nr:MAG: pyridoxine 5'-phosphate synthase [Neisseriales bacterium]